MTVSLSPGLKLNQLAFQTWTKGLYTLNNQRHSMRLTIGLSARISDVGIDKLNPGSSESYQTSLREGCLRSRRFSTMSGGYGRRHYSTSSKSVMNKFLHHSFELVSQKRTDHHYNYGNGGTNRLKIRHPFLLIFLFLATMEKMRDIHTESSSGSSSNEIPDNIKAILGTDPSKREAEEMIELFNYVLAEGEKEATKARGKDIVIIFGDTGAGKSTLINFLWGCKLKFVDHNTREVVLDPASPIPEVVKTSESSASCTLLAKMVGDLIVKDPNTSEKHSFTFFDMAGLNDTRGSEIDLANAIVMNKIVGNAKSVRFVMVSEACFATKGKNWGEIAELYTKTFRVTDRQSVSLVVTKAAHDIAKIKEDVRKYTPKGCVDLSNHVTVYNPEFDDNKKQLGIIFNITPYPHPKINISIKKNAVIDAIANGENLKKTVYEDLAKDKIIQAKEKIKFAKGIEDHFENPELSQLATMAMLGVTDYLDKLIKDVQARERSSEVRYHDFKKCLDVRDKFQEYIEEQEYSDMGAKLAGIRKDTPDMRPWFDREPEQAASAGFLATAGLLAATVAAHTTFGTSATVGLALTGLGGVAAIGAIGVTAVAAARWKVPSQKQKEAREFYERKI